jgi:hypothetical protein
MTIRDSILSDIRKNQPSARDLPSVPFFHSTTPVDLKEKFYASLKRMAGDTITQYPDDLAQFIVADFREQRRFVRRFQSSAGHALQQISRIGPTPLPSTSPW